MDYIFNEIDSNTVVGLAAIKCRNKSSINKLIVDAYNDNKSLALEMFGYTNIYIAHSLYINSKLSFYEK